ncbi:MAG: hypothetical protein QM755_10440 [Luteolibacter sp.]
MIRGSCKINQDSWFIDRLPLDLSGMLSTEGALQLQIGKQEGDTPLMILVVPLDRSDPAQVTYPFGTTQPVPIASSVAFPERGPLSYQVAIQLQLNDGSAFVRPRSEGGPPYPDQLHFVDPRFPELSYTILILDDMPPEKRGIPLPALP